MDSNECYTIAEVLELLKITEPTLKKWREEGIIKTIKIGRRVLFKRTEIERFLKENTQ